MSRLNLEEIRRHFPSLSYGHGGWDAIFFDNPGGTQVTRNVYDYMRSYYMHSNANVGGAFFTSKKTDEVVLSARMAMADFLNAPEPENIVFGPNMTTLTFHLARSFGDSWNPGDEIIITDLDHDANVTPWMDLEARGAVIRTVGIHPEDCTLDKEAYRAALSERTRLVAITHASNAVGTIPNVAELIRMAHEVGALVFVDAVQYTPHGPIDVQALDCDFLVCSAYKFFGPHVGILYGKREHLERLTPHRVRPSKNTIPNRWETGTLNHACLHGVTAAVDYLQFVGKEFGGDWEEVCAVQGYIGNRQTLKQAMYVIREYEQTLSTQMIRMFRAIPDITVYGITDLERLDERLPTFAFTWPRLSPRATVEHLAQQAMCAWSGNYYALRLMERLGLEAEGGAVRIGLVHYNTEFEISQLGYSLQNVKIPAQ